MINLELLNPRATTLRRTTTQAVGVPAAGGALLVHRATHGLCSARAAPRAASAPSSAHLAPRARRRLATVLLAPLHSTAY